MKIFIDTDLCKELFKLDYEMCGFIYSKRDKFNKMKIIKNKSKSENRFIMSKIGVFLFILFNFFRIRNIGIFHVHRNTGKLSQDDFDNMLSNIPYLIICKRRLFFYMKEKDIVYSISSKRCKEIKIWK